MPDGSFTVFVKGEEAMAENLAWACGRIFGRQPTFFARSGAERPTWSFIVRTGPAGGADEARAWAEMAEALLEASRGMDLAPTLPAPRELRSRLDRLLRYGSALRAERPETEVMIGLPGERPAPLGRVRSRDLAWRLMA